MSDGKVTLNFNGTVGQVVGNVEKMEVHLGKDANVHVANIEHANVTEQRSPRPAAGRTVAAKKARHFLETPTFRYRFSGSDPESNRRIHLLYGILCREYKETKSYIDPDTPPDDFFRRQAGSVVPDKTHGGTQDSGNT